MLGMAFSLVSWMIVHLDEIRFSHVSHMGALSLHLHSPLHSLCRRPNKVPNSKRLQRFQPIFPSLCWMCTNKRHSRHSIGSEFIKNVQYSTISPGLSAVTYVTNYDFFQCVVVQRNCKRQREDGISVWMLQHNESFHNTVRLHLSIRAECEPRSLDVHR